MDRGAVVGSELCRILARQGCIVDIFAETGSPAFRSRFCSRRLVSPAMIDKQVFADRLRSVLQDGNYDVIYLCNEEILEVVLSDSWDGESVRSTSFASFNRESYSQ